MDGTCAQIIFTVLLASLFLGRPLGRYFACLMHGLYAPLSNHTLFTSYIIVVVVLFLLSGLNGPATSVHLLVSRWSLEQ